MIRKENLEDIKEVEQLKKIKLDLADLEQHKKIKLLGRKRRNDDRKVKHTKSKDDNKVIKIKTYLMNHTTNKLDAILGTRLFRHLIALPLPYYERRRVGDTLMRVGALTQIREFLTGSGLMTILDVIFSVVFIAFMLWYSVPLTLISLLTIPLYLAQNIWAVPIIKKKIEAVWRTAAMNNAFMVE